MEFIFEILAELFFALDGVTLIVDVYAWIKGRENRRVRREARQRGHTPPPRDQWNRWVIALSLAFVLLTTVLVLRPW